MTPIGVLCSGGLGATVFEGLLAAEQIEFVATDSKSDRIIALCKEKGIPCYAGNPRSARLFRFLQEKQAGKGLILSINYLFLIEGDIIQRADCIVNFHGSLLPKYRGRTPHVWAVINGEKKTGITAHLIDEGCDTGGIVLQREVEILENDTGGDILDKYAYPQMVSEVIEKYREKSLNPLMQDESKATYFGKRTPDDGKINWDWSKERIRNWVRAQAFPYPGAFTFFGDKKVIIDQVAYSDIGFRDHMTNGTVLQGLPQVVVKTPNGALSLERVRNKEDLIELAKGDILY